MGLGLLRDGVTGWPVLEAIEFWMPPAGDPRSATKRRNTEKPNSFSIKPTHSKNASAEFGAKLSRELNHFCLRLFNGVYVPAFWQQAPGSSTFLDLLIPKQPLWVGESWTHGEPPTHLYDNENKGPTLSHNG